MNDTIARFGHPATLIAEYDHWVVLLRPDQPTLGSLILAAKGEYRAFGDLPAAAFAEMQTTTGAIEAGLAKAVDYRKLNYLMLMMVDPHVHFHVIPRYEGERAFGPIAIADAGWPKAPALGEALALDEAQIAMLTAWLKGYWPA